MYRYRKIAAFVMALCMLIINTVPVFAVDETEMHETVEDDAEEEGAVIDTEDSTEQNEQTDEPEQSEEAEDSAEGSNEATDSSSIREESSSSEIQPENASSSSQTVNEDVSSVEQQSEEDTSSGSGQKKKQNTEDSSVSDSQESNVQGDRQNIKQEEEEKTVSDEIIVDAEYRGYVLPGESIVVNNGLEMSKAVDNHIPNIYMGSDIDVSSLMHPVEIRHTCTVFGQGHILYGTGAFQSQLVMRGENQTLNLCDIKYEEQKSTLGGSLIRQYDGTVNIYKCDVANAMHGVEVDGGTINIHKLKVSSELQGIAITGQSKSATANIYEDVVLSQTSTSSTSENVAGISNEQYSVNRINIYEPIKISGFKNGIFNTGEISDIPSGSDIDSTSCGIYNAAVIQKVSATIHGNTTGIRNLGIVSSCNGEVKSNTTGILNYGNITVSGGNVYSNSVGIDNNGTVTQSGGKIKNNSKYAVLQRGTYRMYGSARIPVSADYSNATDISAEHNIVYLANENGKKHTIEVPDKFTGLGKSAEPVAVIDSGAANVGEGGDRFVGRAAVEVKTSDAATYAETLMPFFALRFSKNYIDDGLKGWYTNHWKDQFTGREQNWVRAGNGVIGSKGTLYYSIRLNAKFKNGLSGREKKVEGFSTVAVDKNGKAITPAGGVPADEGYWRGEDCALEGLSHRIRCYITLPNDKGKNYKYDLNTSLANTGYTCSLTAKDGKVYNKKLSGGETVPGKYMMDAASFTAEWTVRSDVLYSGNKQTNKSTAPDYSKITQNPAAPLDDNLGPKGNAVDSFGNPNYFQRENKTDRYSFAGWSYKSSCKYNDKNLIKVGGALLEKGGDPLDFVFGLLAKCTTISDINPSGNEGSVGVRLYAVWDVYPKLDTPDRSFTLSDLTSGKITDNELKKKIGATDGEDGDVKKSLKLTYDISELNGVDAYNPVKTMSIAVRATDGFGNQVAKTFKADVCYDLAPASETGEDISGGGEESTGTNASPVYLRFIDQKNYSVGLSSHSGGKVNYKAAKAAGEEGGCEPYSVWYTREEYKNALENAFGRLESKKYLMSFEYDYNDIRSIHSYTRSNSVNLIDNAKEWQNSFYKTYVAPNKV